MLQREQQTGRDHQADLAALAEEKAAAEARLRELEARWQRERELAEEIEGLRERLAAPPPAKTDDAAERARWRERLAALDSELEEVQGEAPLLFTQVDGQAVAEVVAGWTGIPLGRMVGDEIRAVLGLRERMAARVIGQPQALRAVAEAIQTARAQLTDPRKPIGVFLMVGTSGVGKTETALTLAENLYGGEQHLTVINMSEFKEEHKVSMLLGAPPGYVGYGEGGVLTEAVRRRPYSVVLLDEMEKAHPGVQDIFYQVFDKGSVRDGEGRDIDFKNTIIIMTSNAGTDLISKLCADPETAPDAAGLAEALRPELLKIFKPAFLGPGHARPLFPAVGRDHPQHRRAAAGAHRPPHRGELPGHLRVRARPRRRRRRPLSRGRERRPQCRADPGADAAAGAVGAFSRAHGGGRAGRRGACGRR